MKTCVTCLYCENVNGTAFCRAPENSYVDLVSGQRKTHKPECFDQRYLELTNPHSCGRAGKWWVSIEAEAA